MRVQEHRPISLPDPADTGASAPEEVRAETRERRATSDADRCRELAGRVTAFIGDMFTLLDSLNAEMRDTQTTSQDQTIQRRSADSHASHQLRSVQLDQALSTQRSANDANQVGDILRWVGVGLSLAIGVLGSIFSGGATLVAAIAISVALIATTTVSICAQEGLIPQNEAMITNLVISGLATLVSFGCTTASLVSAATTTATTVATSAMSAAAQAAAAAATATASATAAAQAAVEVSQAVAQVVAGLTAMTEGGFEIAESVFTRESRDHDTHATRHGHDRDFANECRDAALTVLTDLMRSFGRVAESMAEVREEGNGAMRAAMRFA